MGFKSGVVRGVVLINDTLAANTNIAATSNTGTVSIGNASATAVTILGPTNINASGAANTAFGSTSNTGTVAIGNTSSTSVTIVGPVNINTTATNNTAINSTSSTGTITIGNTSSGVVTINSGTAGILVGTTANAHASTFGSTNSTSATTIQSGSGNIINNTGFTIDSSGRNFNTKQPAFLAYLPSNVTNVTGNAAIFQLGTTTALTKVFDQGTNFNTNGTFTAPVTGKYYLNGFVDVGNVTIGTACFVYLTTSNRQYLSGSARTAGNSNFLIGINVLADMTAGDTATWSIQAIGEGANTETLLGQASPVVTYVSGNLVC